MITLLASPEFGRSFLDVLVVMWRSFLGEGVPQDHLSPAVERIRIHSIFTSLIPTTMRTARFPLWLLIACSGQQAFGQSGDLDTSFGVTADGFVLTHLEFLSDCWAGGISVQPDGKILVGGTNRNNGGDLDFAVVRYNPDGSTDYDFDLDGDVITDISTEDDDCNAMAVQPDGRILLAGTSGPELGTAFAVVRYNSDGSLDSSFSLDGMVTTVVGNGEDGARAMAVQDDGRIVVAGWSGPDFAVVRYNADGTLDDSFGGDGNVITVIDSTYASAEGIALQSDGRIVVAGFACNGDCDFVLVRYLPDGTLDSSFGTDGRVITDIGGFTDVAYAVAIQPDQRILVTGWSYDGLQGDVALVRYLADGHMDNSFDVDGMVTTDIGGDTDVARALVLQPDGHILVAGSSFNGSETDLALVRYDPDGTLDASFNGNGMVTSSAVFNDDVQDLTLQPDGKILAAGDGYPHGINWSHVIVVARYLNDLNVGMVEFVGNSLAMLICPNPLTDEATFNYELSAADALTCALYDTHGRSVRTFFSAGQRTAGPHREILDLSGLAAGHYTVVLSNGEGQVGVQVVKQ